LIVLALGVAAVLAGAGPAAAAIGPTDPEAPVGPTPPIGVPLTPESGVSVDIYGVDGTPSSSIVVLLAITLLSVAPSLLLMTTSFTKIFVVLAMTRNALGLQ